MQLSQPLDVPGHLCVGAWAVRGVGAASSPALSLKITLSALHSLPGGSAPVKGEEKIVWKRQGAPSQALKEPRWGELPARSPSSPL